MTGSFRALLIDGPAAGVVAVMTWAGIRVAVSEDEPAEHTIIRTVEYMPHKVMVFHRAFMVGTCEGPPTDDTLYAHFITHRAMEAERAPRPPAATSIPRDYVCSHGSFQNPCQLGCHWTDDHAPGMARHG